MKPKIKTYSELHWADRGMDKLLVLGVLLAIVVTSVEISSPPALFTSWVKFANVILLGIFFADTSRTFLKSRDIGQYLQHHWPDLLILVIFIVSLSSIFYLGLGRFSWLAREEGLLQGFKIFK